MEQTKRRILGALGWSVSPYDTTDRRFELLSPVGPHGRTRAGMFHSEQAAWERCIKDHDPFTDIAVAMECVAYMHREGYLFRAGLPFRKDGFVTSFWADFLGGPAPYEGKSENSFAAAIASAFDQYLDAQETK